MGLVLNTLLGLLGGGVGASVLIVLARAVYQLFVVGRRTDLDGTLDNHGAIHLVGDAVDLLHVEGVRDDLIVGEGVLGAGRNGLADRGPKRERASNANLVVGNCSGLAGERREGEAHLEDNHSEESGLEILTGGRDGQVYRVAIRIGEEEDLEASRVEGEGVENKKWARGTTEERGVGGAKGGGGLAVSGLAWSETNSVLGGGRLSTFDAETFFETATNHGFWGLDLSRASSLSGFLPLIWFLWTIELTQCCPGMQRDVPSMQDMLRDGGHGA